MFQRRVYKTTETIPEKLTDVLDVETFSKAKSYGIDKNSFSIAEEWFNMIVSTVSIKYLMNICCFYSVMKYEQCRYFFDVCNLVYLPTLIKLNI